MSTKRVTVSLPKATAEQLAARADAAGAASVSAYVAEAVTARMRREAALSWLDEIWGPADPQTLAQAQQEISGPARTARDS